MLKYQLFTLTLNKCQQVHDAIIFDYGKYKYCDV